MNDISLFGINYKTYWGVSMIVQLIVIALMIRCLSDIPWYSTDTWSGNLKSVVTGEFTGETYQKLADKYCAIPQQESCELFSNLEFVGLVFTVSETIAIFSTVLLLVGDLINILNFRCFSIPLISLSLLLISHSSAVIFVFSYLDFSCEQDSLCTETGTVLLHIASLLILFICIPKGVSECYIKFYYIHRYNTRIKRMMNCPKAIVIKPPEIKENTFDDPNIHKESDFHRSITVDVK